MYKITTHQITAQNHRTAIPSSKCAAGRRTVGPHASPSIPFSSGSQSGTLNLLLIRTLFLRGYELEFNLKIIYLIIK